MSTIELNTTAQGKRKHENKQQQQKPQQLLVQKQEVFLKTGKRTRERNCESGKLAFSSSFLSV